MFQRLSLLQKFSIICLLMLLLLGVALNLSINYIMEKNLLRYAREMTASVIAGEVAHELTADDLSSVKRGEDYRQLTAKISHLSLGPNIGRIKIWAADRTILWSDDNNVVGFQMPNHEVDEALQGEVVAELTWKQKKTEYLLDDKNYGKRMLELYVPIHFAPESAGVDVVFEVYRDLEPLYARFDQQQQNVWCMIFGTFGLLFLALFTLVRRATRKIEQQRVELSESEAKYRNLVQSAQDGIISVSRMGRIVLCNSSVTQIFGYTPEQLLGQPFEVLLAPQQRQQANDVLADFFQDKDNAEVRLFNWVGLRITKNDFPLEVSFSVSGENGQQLVTAIMRDETERELMQQQALEAEKLAGVALIASSIGHEINNAISGLFGFGQMLRGRSADPSFVNKCAETMISQAEQLRIHAKNLLGLGKPQQAKIGPLDLNQLLETVTEMLQTSGLLKHVQVTKELGKLPLIGGDAHQLEQLIRNLQINAAQAMEGRGSLLLRTGQLDDGQIYLDVEDKGPGIPPEQLQQVFKPFYTTKKPGEGTGLGLHIVRQVVEQHGGKISVDSEIGVGTSFRIYFPPPMDNLFKLAKPDGPAAQ